MRIKNTAERIDHYKEHGYKVFLPENLSMNDPNIKDSLIDTEYIKKLLSNEYDEENYKNNEKYLLNELPKIDFVLNHFFNSLSLKPQETYKIIFTRYGVGGSYYPPDCVIINVRTRKEKQITISVIHEIIHLSIQNLIDKYEIDHWKKERVVDLIMNEIAPEINIMQNIPINTEEIDKTFTKYYPDIERIIKTI
ncbi:MAG: hypothetical protein PHX25_01935 [Candidatus Pacebacteria bacterium]|nr:hypothetical protein [Candidatus Paceibacterota bacterium]